jgi:hypothetical protein
MRRVPAFRADHAPAGDEVAEDRRGRGPLPHPATERKIRNRNRTFRILFSRPMTGLFGWLAKRTANTGTLRDYPLGSATA